VLRVIARLNVGGPARQVLILDRGLREKGYDTLLVHGSVAAGEASLEGLVDERLGVIKIPQLGRRPSLFDDVRALCALLFIVFRESPDVIHTHTAKAGALGRICAAVFNATRRRSRRALIVHTFHGHVLDGYFGLTANWLINLTERTLGAVTDRVVTISPLQRRDIVDRFRIVPDRRAVTIALGLDLEPFLRATRSNAARRKFGIEPEDFAMGYVGRFVPIKDLPTLIDAFRSALRDVPHARLLLAGDGPTRAILEKQVQAHGIADRVRYLGWTQDLVDLYAALDLCILSSINEGTPVAAIEAMASGTAVIATAVGGVPDLIEHDRTGWLVPARDSDALAAKIVAAATDSGKRHEIADAARQEVANRFAAERLVRDMDRLYRTALIDKRGTIERS
jgi:glycosyltransferase involved in cell wall biosynthesis